MEHQLPVPGSGNKANGCLVQGDYLGAEHKAIVVQLKPERVVEGLAGNLKRVSSHGSSPPSAERCRRDFLRAYQVNTEDLC
jgi:hypothetical protein